MDVLQPPRRLASAGVQVTHATSRAVIARDDRGAHHVFVLSPIGWRLRLDPLRDDGDLVTDPALTALLDAAADAAD